MAFAGGVGLDVDVTALGADPLAALFAEELGAVVEVRAADVDALRPSARGTASAPAFAGSDAPPRAKRSWSVTAAERV